MIDWEKITKAFQNEGRRRAREEGKYWGECGSCSQDTCLLQETDMCGPCTFGEAETINGNW